MADAARGGHPETFLLFGEENAAFNSSPGAEDVTKT